MNPMQMMQAFKNPQQFVQSMMNNSQVMQNPMIKNILEMAQKGNVSEIEQIGRNMAKERGLDFNSEFEKFKNQFGMK